MNLPCVTHGVSENGLEMVAFNWTKNIQRSKNRFQKPSRKIEKIQILGEA